ncbi:MAG: PAS domain-containing sensor histidine kinase [Bacillota bacterium]|nr:PAS domain-containing sensor histidine kinase [Bacillota bacterium]
MEIKKIFDLYSIQSLLFGVYKFYRVKIPGFWMRFSIYLTVWLCIAIYLKLDALSAALPIFIFDLLMIGTVCYVIMRYWDQKKNEKVFYCIAFSLWGAMKAFLVIYETSGFQSPNPYIGEMLYAGVLNVCIFIIYLRYIKQELDKTEQRFKIIVENAIDAIFYYTFRPTPTFQYITPSIEEITGYSPQVFYNNPKAMLEIVDKDYFQLINSVFYSGPDAAFPTSEVFKIERKDGASIWVSMNVSVIREDEKIVAVEGIIRDITQMKEAQDDLTTSKRSRDLMLSYISHELKTPITSILGYATALKDGTIGEEEEKQKAVEIISQKSLILERMILDLFQLSQLETNQYSFTYKHMDCLELAEYIREHTTPELKESEVAHKFIIEGEKLEGHNIIVDPVRISQVITNLIVNAIKYTRKKNQITVKCVADDKKKNIIISVADKGIGIAEEDLPHIFERFFKVKDPSGGKTPGSGLGLPLSKEIVEAHKGTIEAKSKYGRGSVFIVTLPIYEETYDE